jgi:hypothetical protein
MRRIFVPTFGPTDWRRLLADPNRQWRQTKSAYECAVAWEAAKQDARGLPPEVASLLDAHDQFRGATLLLGLPEHQVVLDGGGHLSQTDLWLLIDAPIGVTSVAVEAKAGEPFDETVSDWLKDASEKSGKPTRLRQVCGILRLLEPHVQKCRYQLLHRSAAAILEAKRFRLRNALFLVHAFGENGKSLEDYRYWASLLGVKAEANCLTNVGIRNEIDMWIAWLSSKPADDKTVRAAV